MALVSHSETARATPAEVWAWYADVSRWPRWDGGIRDVTLNGPFASGTRGTVTLANGRKSKVRLLDVEDNSRFTDRVKLRGITVTTIHRIEPDGVFTRITHDVVLGGLLGRLFPRLIAIPVRRTLPATVAQVAFLAARDASSSRDLPLA
jgi:carbon monoxide dehydrogenase subunit G